MLAGFRSMSVTRKFLSETLFDKCNYILRMNIHEYTHNVFEKSCIYTDVSCDVTTCTVCICIHRFMYVYTLGNVSTCVHLHTKSNDGKQRRFETARPRFSRRWQPCAARVTGATTAKRPVFFLRSI